MTLSNCTEPEKELEDALLSYLTAVDAGRAPDKQVFVARHPQFAAELEAFFADQDRTMPYVAPLRNLGPAAPAVLRDPSFGDYELLEELGRGGMGVVFKARQVSLNRPVALKMILAGHLASPTDVQRFRAEAETGARLDHAHTVPIYEVGEHQGQHYFTMKLMEGGSLAGQIGLGLWKVENQEQQRRAATLVATLARAVEHAHQRGLLHRDLKPGNILFDLEGRAHVSDFGLSKSVRPATDGGQVRGACLTVSGMVVGTPSYMAPEQATALRTVTTAADVYSLGAVLYELLTGKAPFQAATHLETLRQVTSTEPTRPRGLNPLIDRDLETITLKCLEKDPRGRYGSAAALAEDLERWLAGEPIHARPAGPVERAAKWARRRPASAALYGILATAFLAGLGALVWNWRAAEDAKRDNQARADQEARDKHRLAVKLYFKNVALARLEFADNNLARANELLAECEPSLRGWEWHFLDRYFHADSLTIRRHTAGVVGLAFSADGDRLASVSSPRLDRHIYEGTFPGGHRKATTSSLHGRAGAIRILKTSDGSEILRIDPQTDLVYSLALSPDGKSVACSGATNTGTGLLKVFDASSGAELLSLTAHKGPVRSVAYSRDGTRLASGGDDGTAKLWDARSGLLLRTIADRDSSINSVSSVAFSPDGKLLAGAILEDATARIWDTATGRQVNKLLGHTANVTRLVFSPDGQRLATASEDRTVRLWQTESGRELLKLTGHVDGVTGVAFSADGRRLVSAGYDKKVRVWDAATGLLCFTLAGHAGPVFDVAFSPDGGRIASSSLDDTIKVWHATGGHAVETLRPADGTLAGLVFSPDGRLLAGAGGKESKDVVIEESGTGKITKVFKGHEQKVVAVAYSPDVKRLASLSQDNVVRVWDPATGRAVQTLLLGGRPTDAGDFQGLAFSPDGKLLAAASTRKETVTVWVAATGQELHDIHERASSVAFSPDARRLASAGWDGLKVREAESGQEVFACKGRFYSVLFSPDGSRLIALGDEGVKMLDAATGREVMALPPRNDQRLDLMALSPDGRRLALVNGNVIYLRDTTSGEEALALPGHAALVVGLAFSPDGRRLVSADTDGVVRSWDATPRR